MLVLCRSTKEVKKYTFIVDITFIPIGNQYFWFVMNFYSSMLVKYISEEDHDSFAKKHQNFENRRHEDTSDGST